jgi:hypothetical protein
MIRQKIDQKIEFYSGARGDEIPRAVIAQGRRLEIIRILKREIIGSLKPEDAPCRIFMVETQGGTSWEIREVNAEPGGWIITRCPGC